MTMTESIIDQLNAEIAEAMKAGQVVGRDSSNSEIWLEGIIKVDSIENTLRFIPFEKKDAYIWELIGIVDDKLRFPRKLKKRLSDEEKGKRAFAIKHRRILKIKKELPDTHNYALLIGKEIIRLGCKYLIKQ
jgi:hypothetical protein